MLPLCTCDGVGDNSAADAIRRLIEPNGSRGVSRVGRLWLSNRPVGQLFFGRDPVLDIPSGLAAAQEI